VKLLGLHVQDTFEACAGSAARLLNNKGQGVCLVEKSQFAIRILLVPRIHEDTTLEQVTVEIRYQGAEVSR